MAKLGLTREELSKFFTTHQSIRAFEQVFDDVGGTLPSTIESANALAGQALSVANGLVSLLDEVGAAYLESTATVSHLNERITALEAEVEAQKGMPFTNRGTMAGQDSDTVDILGGQIRVDSGSSTAPTLGFAADPAAGFYRYAPSAIGWTGAFSIGGAFGCNGNAPVAKQAVNAAATNESTTMALTNQLRLALINVGICI